MTTEASEVATTSSREVLQAFVAKRATQLQSDYAQDKSTAVATLARLRRAMSSTGEFNPQVWDIFDEMPDQLIGWGDEPSSAERAAVAALTLFATHQQGRRDLGMHRSGYQCSLGQAVSTLHRAADSKGVSARFRALTRGSDLATVLPHLRSLITQLRGARIPLDYAALAKDLYDLQYPDGMERVRVRWIRAFHAPARPQSDTEPTSPTHSDAETTTLTDSGDDA